MVALMATRFLSGTILALLTTCGFANPDSCFLAMAETDEACNAQPREPNMA